VKQRVKHIQKQRRKIREFTVHAQHKNTEAEIAKCFTRDPGLHLNNQRLSYHGKGTLWCRRVRE